MRSYSLYNRYSAHFWAETTLDLDVKDLVITLSAQTYTIVVFLVVRIERHADFINDNNSRISDMTRQNS